MSRVGLRLLRAHVHMHVWYMLLCMFYEARGGGGGLTA